MSPKRDKKSERRQFNLEVRNKFWNDLSHYSGSVLLLQVQEYYVKKERNYLVSLVNNYFQRLAANIDNGIPVSLYGFGDKCFNFGQYGAAFYEFVCRCEFYRLVTLEKFLPLLKQYLNAKGVAIPQCAMHPKPQKEKKRKKKAKLPKAIKPVKVKKVIVQTPKAKKPKPHKIANQIKQTMVSYKNLDKE